MVVAPAMSPAWQYRATQCWNVTRLGVICFLSRVARKSVMSTVFSFSR